MVGLYMPIKPINANRIVDVAISLAEEKHSWRDVHLYQVADYLKIDLIEIKKHFYNKDAISNAWFDRADEAMLNESKKEFFKQLSKEKQLHLLIMTWLHALSVHKHITKQMLKSKLTSGHFHIPACMMMRLHRTAEWIQEAMQEKKTRFSRFIREKAISCILTEILIYWCFDKSKENRKTSEHLNRLITLRQKFKKRPDQ